MELTLTGYFVLPVFLSLGMVVGLWVYYTRRRPEMEKHPGEGKIYRCERCQMVYVERRLYPTLACPRCHYENSAIRR